MFSSISSENLASSSAYSLVFCSGHLLISSSFSAYHPSVTVSIEIYSYRSSSDRYYLSHFLIFFMIYRPRLSLPVSMSNCRSRGCCGGNDFFNSSCLDSRVSGGENGLSMAWGLILLFRIWSELPTKKMSLLDCTSFTGPHCGSNL